MKWIYPFIATLIRFTACQTLISNTECPALDELVRVNARNGIELRKEMEELNKEKERLLKELSLQRDWIKSILLQSNGIPDCMWYKIMYPDAQSGVYKLTLKNRQFQAYCDMETDGGGWTVILSRSPWGVGAMNRSWQEYKHGFGNVAGQFYWIGNDNIHELTKHRPSDVYITLEFTYWSKWSKYTNMTVLSEEYKYRLSFDENSYEGNFADLLGGDGYKDPTAHNIAFSTYDSDNDGWTNGNCAEIIGGGWWFSDCFESMTEQSYIMSYMIRDPRTRNMMMIRYKKPK